MEEFDLQRFVEAQDPVYDNALAILRGGAMCTPYMDFIFPRLRDQGGLGFAARYAIRSLDEARALLAFPWLGNRYRECLQSLSWLSNQSAADVFGEDDARKLQASLTLFAEASNEHVMRIMLSIWFDDRVDEQTIVRLDLVP